MADLIEKYNQPLPRYTSYPSVSLWEDNIKEGEWIKLVRKSYDDFGNEEGLNLHLHFPYCESLCTYCGCTKQNTSDHGKEISYIEALKKEWDAYLKHLPEKPKLASIHLGGGSPTFFSAEHLKEVISYIQATSTPLNDAQYSLKGHPNTTSYEHLLALSELGFKRISFGIQDFDPSVQQAIHRIQPFKTVREASYLARLTGFTSINFDLIYGLPHQTPESIIHTMEQVGTLRPERIAFYSYAHMPSSFPAQKRYENHLPPGEMKQLLYKVGRKTLQRLGYQEIGMDHFALPVDELLKAKQQGTLHRNFMGSTTHSARMLLGLGNNAISDIHYAYAQNPKMVDDYKKTVMEGKFSPGKTHLLHNEDHEIRNIILKMICLEKVKLNEGPLSMDLIRRLQDMQKDGIITIKDGWVELTAIGKPYLRNVCAAFDKRLQEGKTKTYVFSRAI
ncbi:coproporphyrinogen-III oxidase [Echinicola pacifica]|uniref:Coproporphyrinogen-III oxidase n=1 Tax=Echinicola pacifica TaxID=346377 RepID=A0A918UW48_9BACT|nr:oxygen-independent coproporphyrinogen III oxidase [Echinicola pacifica]GGZ38646.1 coproporphyrinogen-III oxidase [Echinicola pacifica]